MIFNTWVYAAFTLATFLLYWFLVPGKWRAVVLLTASYLFFTYHFPFHTLLIVIMTLIIYYLSLLLFKYKPRYDQGEALAWYVHPKFILTVSIVFAVSVLSYYKYLKMAISTLNEFFKLVDVEKAFHIPAMVVPLGLSFFVFEFIHYAIDVYQGKAKQTGLFQFAVFIMYFPTLVSGPIKRWESFNDQTVEFSQTKFKKVYLYEGLSRILVGLFKKAVIADHMNVYADYLLDPTHHNAHQLVFAMYAYAIKIYFDFSGYSDIAIGSARLFGYRVPENFNYPYFQKNIADFWNNWHMSLSSWIRDYIYIPLGGSRGSTSFAARNSLIAMAVSGLWHGAAWHFVFWGLYHGVGMAWLRYWRKWRKKRQAKPFADHKPGTLLGTPPKIRGITHWLSVLFTFHFVTFGWIFFYCDFTTAYLDIRKIAAGAYHLVRGLM